VGVGIEVTAITAIDSLMMTVGLEARLAMTWEDTRVGFPQLRPQENEEFEFNPSVLR
jgi:hypothetical protein